MKNSERKLIKLIEDHQDDLKLTEEQWYDYQYYKKRNYFIIKNIFKIKEKIRDIYLIEAKETFVGTILRNLGYNIISESIYCLEKLKNDEIQVEVKEKTINKYLEYFDMIILLNIFEVIEEEPWLFLNKKQKYINKEGRILIITENINQFKNRIKKLLGYNLYMTSKDEEIAIRRMLSFAELTKLLTEANYSILKSKFINHYSPYRIEPINIKRLLFKYINYYFMKAISNLRKEIYIEAKKLNRKKTN